MLRLDRGYRSLFEYLIDIGFPPTVWMDKIFYKGEAGRKRWNPHPHAYQQIVGAFQPLADIWKDVVDTFTPYKSEYHIQRDATQPFRSIGNGLRGILQIACTPIVFLGIFIKDIFQANSLKDFGVRTGSNAVRSFSWILSGALYMFRGITQFVTTPLAYLRLIVRCTFTPCFPYPKIEHNTGIQNLFKASTTNHFQEDESLRGEMHRKFIKSLARSQDTVIPEAQEQGLYEKGTMHTYLQLFSLNQEEQSASLAVDVKGLALRQKC